MGRPHPPPARSAAAFGRSPSFVVCIQTFNQIITSTRRTLVISTRCVGGGASVSARGAACNPHVGSRPQLPPFNIRVFQQETSSHFIKKSRNTFEVDGNINWPCLSSLTISRSAVRSARSSPQASGMLFLHAGPSIDAIPKLDSREKVYHHPPRPPLVQRHDQHAERLHADRRADHGQRDAPGRLRRLAAVRCADGRAGALPTHLTVTP